MRSNLTRLLTFKELMMERTETSSCGTYTKESTNNGISSISRTGLRSQLRDNSTKTSVSMLIEPSILSLDYQLEDTSTIHMEETW